MTMVSRLLVANRGEIACRIIETARFMGIRTVAVYSEADRQARHVRLSDEAVCIGPAAAAESYLAIDRIMEAARLTGADAIHPGYGFLAESAEFAAACEAAGLTFIGPPASAIRAMGSKSEAKRLMAEAGVPLVPGDHEIDQDPKRLARVAQDIGFPVLIKASAGGGGKGMKRVDRAEDFADALASAKREAASSFGDERVLVEKCLTHPRHVEIQVFFDQDGNGVHLFERDCSIQRRHQKIVEEAPAPDLDKQTRHAMGQAALAAARTIGYVGAGTVEFILDADPAGNGAFYFMEMNTRLQVEHPVTEMITGLDLVEWQILVASGAPLPLGQADIPLEGHAIEVRLYAENPERGFLPSAGALSLCRWPTERPGLRLDTGVDEGDFVTAEYDPMLAKMIAHGPTRKIAAARLAVALGETRLVGPATNLGFLRRVITHPAFLQGELHTGFIQSHEVDLFPPEQPLPDRVLAEAAVAILVDYMEAAALHAGQSADPWSPWHRVDGWRLNGEGGYRLQFAYGVDLLTVGVVYQGRKWRLELPGGPITVSGQRRSEDVLEMEIGGHVSEVLVYRQGAELVIFRSGEAEPWCLRHYDPVSEESDSAAGAGELTAPMPGRVIDVRVAPGQEVTQGEILLILEAMKMEHTLEAPMNGVVSDVTCAVGDSVDEGIELITIKSLTDEAS